MQYAYIYTYIIYYIICIFNPKICRITLYSTDLFDFFLLRKLITYYLFVNYLKICINYEIHIFYIITAIILSCMSVLLNKMSLVRFILL